MTTLTFQNTTLSVINQRNQTFLTASDLGLALEYASPLQAVLKIYDRNADEFTENMTALIEMPTAGGIQKVRVFSLRGAHLIAMFARTKVAKEFRKWVLDILDNETQMQQPVLPVIEERTFNHSLKNSECVDIGWLWFGFSKTIEFVEHLTPALEVLGSQYAPRAHSIKVEYGRMLNNMGKLIHRITREADFGYNPAPLNALCKHLEAKPKRAIKHYDF